MSGVKIRVRADAAQASREIGKLEKSVVSLDKRATAVSKSFRNLAVGITAAFTGGALTKSITRSADSMTDFGNRVNLVTRDVQKTKVVMDELFKIAARSRGSVDAAAETFNRFGLALQDANKPVGELLKVTEAVQKAAVISGSGAQSAKAAIVQLGQGLASGQLRGQELNSVLEQMPRLAKAIADGMGIPFGKLREEAMAGKITAEAVYKAILEGAQEIDDEYNTLNATVSGLATVFGNEWTRAIANLDKAIGTSEGIADGIRFATIAVKSFGENIIGFSVLVGGELLLAKLKVQRFARDIGGFVTGIFTGDINGKDMADSIVKGFNSAKKTLGDKTSIAIKFSAKKIDLLAEMLPSMDTAKATIKTFTTAVADLFKGLWKAVVGDSYWTGIFDPSHMEDGQTIAVGSSLKKFLDNPLTEIRTWSGKLQQLFSDLNFEIYDLWLSTITSVKEVGFGNALKIEADKVGVNLDTIVDKFEKATTSMSSKWTTLSSDIEKNGIKPTVSLEVETLWSNMLTGMTTAYDNFNASLTKATGKEKDVLPSTTKVSENFNKGIDGMTKTFNTFVELLSNTTLVVGAKGVTSTLREDFSTKLTDFKTYLGEQGDVAGALFATALFVGFRKGLAGALFRKAIGVALISSVVSLQDNEEFQESAKSTARGFGKLLGDFFASGDGDLISSIASGIATFARSISEGFLEGLYGPEFENEALTKLGTALTIMAGAFVFSATARKAFVAIGAKTAGYIFGSKFVTTLATKLGSAFIKLAVVQSLLTKVKSLGLTLGTTMQKGLLVGLAAGLVIALGRIVSESVRNATKGAFNFIGRVANGENKTEQADRQIAEFKQQGNLISTLSDGGIIDLGSASEATLRELAASITSLEETPLVPTLKSFISLTGKSDLQYAIENLEKVIEKRGLQLEVKSKEGFGNSTTPGFSTGGPVNGAGTGTSDDIPAMLSNGEYVMKQSAVQKFGSGFMSSINKGIVPAFRNKGGPIGTAAFTGFGVTGQSNRLALELMMAQEENRTQDSADIIAQLTLLNNLNQTQVSLLEEGGKDNVGKALEGNDEGATKAAQGYAENFQNAFKNGLSELLHGGDLKDVLGGLLDNFTSSVIDSFASSFTESAFKNVTPMLTDLFKGIGGIGGKAGGGGGTDWLGMALNFGSSLFGGPKLMSQGGVVPNVPGSVAGKDSVPAMLMPGEVVLSKNQLKNMDNPYGGGSTQSFNINVQGDVSRQTRIEIVKMMPQIAGGVNAQNKENNFKR
jgi:tape measure domain-containing protein